MFEIYDAAGARVHVGDYLTGTRQAPDAPCTSGRVVVIHAPYILVGQKWVKAVYSYERSRYELSDWTRAEERQEERVQPPKTGGIIPLALRDTPPYPAVWARLTGVRSDGLPDGFHTGGAWHDPVTNAVWKPLDGRPNPLAEYHLPTAEANALDMMADTPGFPRNWVTQCMSYIVADVVHWRGWLIRQHAVVIDAQHLDLLTLGLVLELEAGLRTLNRRGWGVNDALSVALDEYNRPFFLDLSNAGPSGRYEDEEYCYWLPFLRQIGYGHLADLRLAGRHIANGLLLWQDRLGYHNGHVYAGLGAPPKRKPRGSVLVKPAAVKREIGEVCPQVRYWLVRPCEAGPLPEATVNQLGLIWAWSPIRRSSSSPVA